MGWRYEFPMENNTAEYLYIRIRTLLCWRTTDIDSDQYRRNALSMVQRWHGYIGRYNGYLY